MNQAMNGASMPDAVTRHGRIHSRNRFARRVGSFALASLVLSLWKELDLHASSSKKCKECPHDRKCPPFATRAAEPPSKDIDLKCVHAYTFEAFRFAPSVTSPLSNREHSITGCLNQRMVCHGQKSLHGLD